jgi:hypothetical protein
MQQKPLSFLKLHLYLKKLLLPPFKPLQLKVTTPKLPKHKVTTPKLHKHKETVPKLLKFRLRVTAQK